MLVEGLSDRRAVETLARRRGRDLLGEGIAVVATGGFGNLPRVLKRYQGVRLAGLYDVGEERHFLHAAATTAPSSSGPAFMRVRATSKTSSRVRSARTEWSGSSRSKGDLRAFRTYQKQPAHRDRPLEEQLYGFMWNRKQRYAVLLVEALDLDRIPRPLDRALAHV